jgi:type III secretion protein S
VGLLVASAQAVTQIQDQSLSLALKLIAVMVVLALASPWIASALYHAADQLFANIGFGGSDVQ